MTTIQKYFLYALMLNTVCLSAMLSIGHDAGRIAMESHKREEEDDKADVFSKYRGEVLIKKIHDRIDLRHLGVGKYDCCKSIKSAIASYYQTSYLSEEKATTEIQTIQSYIPATLSVNEKKHIFSQLTKKHWYVHYLKQNLVQHKFEQFENVKGSTIDALSRPNFSNDINGLKKQIYTDAQKRFCGYPNKKGCYPPSQKLFLEYLYHTAFENSRLEDKELTALKNSALKWKTEKATSI